MNAPVVPGLCILVLAAGFSRRLGQAKATARVRGVGLLRRTALVLAPLSRRPLIVVVPPRSPRLAQELAGLPVRCVPNRRRSAGQSTSLQAGFVAARWSAATLVVAADLPALGRTDVARLVRCWRAAPRRVAARRIGAHGGMPLILPKRYYPWVRQISGDVGLRELLARLPRSDRRLVGMRSAGPDVDTPQDLRRARRSWRRC